MSCPSASTTSSDEHGVAGHAVLRAAQPARVGRDVAADRRDADAARVGGVEQAVRAGGGVEVGGDDAGLDDGDLIVRADLDDPVEPRQVEHDARRRRRPHLPRRRCRRPRGTTANAVRAGRTAASPAPARPSRRVRRSPRARRASRSGPGWPGSSSAGETDQSSRWTMRSSKRRPVAATVMRRDPWPASWRGRRPSRPRSPRRRGRRCRSPTRRAARRRGQSR